MLEIMNSCEFPSSTLNIAHKNENKTRCSYLHQLISNGYYSDIDEQDKNAVECMFSQHYEMHIA